MNQLCYKYDNIYFKEGILDDIIDDVYVILLEGTHRTNNVYTQLNEFKSFQTRLVGILNW